MGTRTRYLAHVPKIQRPSALTSMLVTVAPRPGMRVLALLKLPSRLVVPSKRRKSPRELARATWPCLSVLPMLIPTNFEKWSKLIWFWWFSAKQHQNWNCFKKTNGYRRWWRKRETRHVDLWRRWGGDQEWATYLESNFIFLNKIWQNGRNWCDFDGFWANTNFWK